MRWFRRNSSDDSSSAPQHVDGAAGLVASAGAASLADLVARVDHGIALGRAGNLVPAQRMLTDVVADLDRFRLARTGEDDRGEVLHQLARARWRLAMVLNLTGEPTPAIATGVLAVQSGRGWLRTLPDGADQYGDAAVEVAVMAIDAAEIGFVADRSDLAFDLLQQAFKLCSDVDSIAARRALGSARHSHANALINATLTEARSGRLTVADADRVAAEMQTAHEAALAAVTLRRELRSPDDATTWYELANSLLLLSIATALQNQRDAAVAVLMEALQESRPLAPGAAVNAFRMRAADHAHRLGLPVS